MSKTIIIIVAAIALTVGPAVLQGRFSNRWGAPPNLNAAGEQLHQLPRAIGAWQNVEDQRPLSEAVCRELGLVEHFHRQYAHSVSGDRLDVLLMVGPPGRLVRHPPDICYSNRANRQIGEAQTFEISGESTQHRFKLLNFARTSQPVPSEFCVAYAFATGDGIWKTPSSPRMAFGGAPVLYKLQVLSESQREIAEKEMGEFLSQFVEAFPAVLVGDAGGSKGERTEGDSVE